MDSSPMHGQTLERILLLPAIAKTKNLQRAEVYFSRFARKPNRSLYVFANPVIDKLDDLVAILVEEHLMHVAVYAHVFQTNKFVFHARLIEPLGDAGVKNAMVGALGGDREDPNVLHPDELVDRFLLHIAWNLIRAF